MLHVYHGGIDQNRTPAEGAGARTTHLGGKLEKNKGVEEFSDGGWNSGKMEDFSEK
jgi:hypothetical protein